MSAKIEQSESQPLQIIFEGITGSGKSTQISKLAHELFYSLTMPNLITPSARSAELQRQFPPQILRDYSPLARALAFTFLRLWEENELRARIEESKRKSQLTPIILRDRWLGSILAHDLNWLNIGNRNIIESLWRIFHLQLNPAGSKTILLDLDPKIALERQKARSREEGDFITDPEALALTRAGYLALQKKHQANWKKLDADLNSTDLNQRVLTIVQNALAARK